MTWHTPYAFYRRWKGRHYNGRQNEEEARRLKESSKQKIEDARVREEAARRKEEAATSNEHRASGLERFLGKVVSDQKLVCFQNLYVQLIFCFGFFQLKIFRKHTVVYIFSI